MGEGWGRSGWKGGQRGRRMGWQETIWGAGINIFSPPAGTNGGEETEVFAKAVAQTALVNMD